MGSTEGRPRLGRSTYVITWLTCYLERSSGRSVNVCTTSTTIYWQPLGRSVTFKTMLCSRSVFRCFKKLERWGNIVTGAAGPYFVGLAVILISLGTICFCECVPQISIWNRRSRNIQLTWLLQPSHFPSSQYQYAFSLHSTCWCTTSTWLRLSQVFWKILHENMAQVSFGQRKAIGRASRRRWQAGFGGRLEAWRSHLHHIQGAPNVSNWGQRYVFVQFGDTLLNKACAIGFFFFRGPIIVEFATSAFWSMTTIVQ